MPRNKNKNTKCLVCGDILTTKQRKYCSNETRSTVAKYYYDIDKTKHNRKKMMEKKWQENNRPLITARQIKYNKKRRKEDKTHALKETVRTSTKHHFNKIKSKCEFCKDTNNLDFHHFIYKMPVERSHFIVVCKKCHLVLHKHNLTVITNGDHGGNDGLITSYP